MRAKFVFEMLYEVSHSEDRWADEELRRWDIKQGGKDPLREYIKTVVKGIFDLIPDELQKHTGLTLDMIDDIITSPVESDSVLTRDVYDYYNDHKPVNVAIMELGHQVENYIGVGDDMV